MRALTEVEAAHKLGFKLFREFAAAIDSGHVPRADVDLPDGPRWSETRLDEFLRGELDGRSLSAEERRLIGRMETRGRG